MPILIFWVILDVIFLIPLAIFGFTASNKHDVVEEPTTCLYSENA